RPLKEGGDRPEVRKRIEADLSRVTEGVNAELKAVIRRLRAENEELRQELTTLRREREELARTYANLNAAHRKEAEAIERIVLEVMERRRADEKRVGDAEGAPEKAIAAEREQAQAKKREAIEREQA